MASSKGGPKTPPGQVATLNFEGRNTMKEAVIKALSSHDQVRAEARNGYPSRAEMAAYLNDVFSKAEQFDALAARVAELEKK